MSLHESTIHCFLAAAISPPSRSAGRSFCPCFGEFPTLAIVSSRSRSMARVSSLLLPFLSPATLGLDPLRPVIDKLSVPSLLRRLLKSAMVGTLFIPKSLPVRDLFLKVALRRNPLGVDPVCSDASVPGGGARAWIVPCREGRQFVLA